MAPDFKKKTVSAVGGSDYEVMLLTLFATGGFHDYRDHNWKLSNENINAGKFEDLVFETELGDILLQAKHKENGTLSDNDFLSVNSSNNFSLAKYILSFKGIKSFKNVSLILCTNSQINRGTNLFINGSSEQYEMISKICSNVQIYKLKHEILIETLLKAVNEYKIKLKEGQEFKDVVVDICDIESFVDKFVCIVLPDGTIENSIRCRLDIFEKQYNISISYKYVTDQIKNWYSEKPSKATYMTNDYFKSILYSESSKKYIESLLSETIEFKSTYRFSEFNLVLGEASNLKIVKIFQSLGLTNSTPGMLKENLYNKIIFFKVYGCMKILQEFINCFYINKYKYLIVQFDDVKSSDVVDFCDKVKVEVSKLKNQNSKTVICVLNDQCLNEANYLQKFCEPLSLNDFTDNAKNYFLQKKILFQGSPTNLNTFINLVDEKLLADLYTVEEYHIGDPLKKLGVISNYYIKRTLNNMYTSINEDELLEKCEEKFLVISDQPGSGKSTLLVEMANNLKTLNPHHWIMPLNLKTTVSYLNQMENISLFDALEALEQYCKNDFEKTLLRHVPKVIIVDGIDEISEKDRKALILFLNKLSLLDDDIVKIVVTTRYYTFILEEFATINDLLILTLQEFTEQEQIEFFQKYFYFKQKFDNVDIPKFVKTLPNVLLHFLSIPLYTEMVADIVFDKISEETTSFESLDFKHNNTYELFERFLQRKRDVFIRSKSNSDSDSVLSTILDDCFRRYLEDLEIHAIRSNFTDTKFLKLLNIDINQEIDKTVLHVGILEHIQNNIIFVHKTFEEFFVARHIWKQLKKNENNEELFLFIYQEIFLHIEKQNICHFIDCILEQDSDTQKHYQISQNFGKLLENLWESSWQQNKNIMNLASQGSVNILKLLLDNCSTVSNFINNKGKHGETAVLLAGHHLPTIEYLVKKGADISEKDNNGFTILHYATTQFSSFEDFESQLSALSSSLHYRQMMIHIQSVRTNLYRYKELDTYIKRLVSQHQKSIILRRQGNNFNKIADYCKSKGLDFNVETKIGTSILHYVAYCGRYKEFKYLIKQGASIFHKDSYENNIVHYAVLGGNVTILKYLYSRNINLNEKNSNGVAPIHFIPIGNSIDVVNFFITIKDKVPINTEDSFGRNLLFYINSATSLELLQLLIKCGIDIDQKSSDLRYNMLHMAAYTGALEIVKYLINEYPILYCCDKIGQYPEHYAAEGNSVNVLKHFLRSKSDITNIIDLRGQSVLHLAAVGDSLNAVKYLVETLGMNPDLKDFSLRSAVHCAAGAGSRQVIEYFISRNVNLNLRDDMGATVLHYAADSNSSTVFEYIYRQINVDQDAVDYIGNHCLHYAVKSNTSKILLFLLELGVNYKVVDYKDNNILHTATMCNMLETTQYIFDKYPDLYAQNKLHKFPLHYAVEVDALNIVKYYIAKGKDHNILLKNKVNILHLAASKNAINVFMFLIEELGMDPKIGNKDGKLCIHYAAENESFKIIKYLEQRRFPFTDTDLNGGNVLHHAASGNAIKALEYFTIEKYMPLLTPDKGGKLPLHYACRNNRLNVVKYWLQTGLKIDTPDYRNSNVLHWCAIGNALETLRFLVKKCHFDKLHDKDNSGKIPLDLAVEYDSVEVLDFILNYDVFTVIDQDGNTLLHIAAQYDSIKVIKYLLNEEGMYNYLNNNLSYLFNKYNKTPIDIAIQNKSQKVMEYFNVYQKQKRKHCAVM
ncbi:uncharacterized protein [Diabrotica undecimpunctata]|uniref:uncharacterized protein n=1 Tax=Diabrotica undecimpunctata TaxID=50387 RepID=UPI003B63DBBB